MISTCDWYLLICLFLNHMTTHDQPVSSDGRRSPEKSSCSLHDPLCHLQCRRSGPSGRDAWLYSQCGYDSRHSHLPVSDGDYLENTCFVNCEALLLMHFRYRCATRVPSRTAGYQIRTCLNLSKFVSCQRRSNKILADLCVPISAKKNSNPCSALQKMKQKKDGNKKLGISWKIGGGGGRDLAIGLV